MGEDRNFKTGTEFDCNKSYRTDNKITPWGRGRAHVTPVARVTLDLEKFRHDRLNEVECDQQIHGRTTAGARGQRRSTIMDGGALLTAPAVTCDGSRVSML